MSRCISEDTLLYLRAKYLYYALASMIHIIRIEIMIERVVV